MADNEDIEKQKELNSEVEKNLSFEEEILFILNKRRGIEGETLKDQQDINNVLADQTKQLKFQIAEKRTITSLSNKISKIATSAYTVSRDEVGTSKTINQLTKDQLDLDKTIQSLDFERQKQLKGGEQINIDVANSIEMQVEEAVKLKEEIAKIQEESSKVAKSLGSKSFGGLSKVVGSIPGLKGLSGPFEAAAEAARAQGAENLQNFGHVEGLTKAEKAKNEESNKQLDIQVEAKKNFDKEFQAQSKSGKARRTDTKIYQKGLKNAGIDAEDLAKKVKMGKLPVKSIGTFKAGFKSLGPVLSKALGPLALVSMAVKAIKFFVDAMLSASKATAEMSRNMLISRDSARELYKTTKLQADKFNLISKEQGNQTILAEDYLKAISTINSQLGVQLDLARGFGQQTTDNVLEVARMQANFGLSAEAATQLFMESVNTGTSLQDNNKSIFGTLGLMSAQSGIQVDINKTIEEAAAIQGNLRANFRGSTESLAAAVFQAKLLGLNLSQVAGAGEKLLDFESSIGAEMEAELLTGKQLNLEKAREYALMGKTDLLMKEISEQAGTQEDFLKMNVIQRKALAKAVGLEVNELADMYSKKAKMDALAKKNLEIKNALMKDGQLILDENFDLEKASLQEIQIAAKAAGKSEAELRDILGDQIYLRKQEEDATQKFNKAIQQVKEAFMRLVDGGMIDKLASGLENLLSGPLFDGGVEKLTEEEQSKSVIKNSTGNIEQDAKFAKQLQIANQTQGAFGLSTSFSSDGINTNKEIREAREYVKNNKSTETPTNTPTQTPTGTAEVTVTPTETPINTEDFILRPGKAPIKFRKDDLLIGGTNLEGSGGNNTQAVSGGNNNEVAMLLKELISEVRKGGDVYMDGNKVGRSIALATSNLG